VVERIERHDVINAALLAAVLLGMAFVLLLGARSLFATLGVNDPELIEAGATTTTAAPAPTIAPTTTVPPETTTTVGVAHPTNEVIVRIGNGAGRGGIAGAGTEVARQAGYKTLSAKNADTIIERSTIYHLDGYAPDAEALAAIMGVAPANILPMPDNPGIPPLEAHLVVILGQDTTLG
jgi:hypothetical protein